MVAAVAARRKGVTVTVVNTIDAPLAMVQQYVPAYPLY